MMRWLNPKYLLGLLFSKAALTPEARDKKAEEEFDSLLKSAAKDLSISEDDLFNNFYESVDGGHMKAWMDSTPLGKPSDPTEWRVFVWKDEKPKKNGLTQQERILEDFKRYIEKRKNPKPAADLEL